VRKTGVPPVLAGQVSRFADLERPRWKPQHQVRQGRLTSCNNDYCAAPDETAARA